MHEESTTTNDSRDVVTQFIAYRVLTGSFSHSAMINDEALLEDTRARGKNSEINVIQAYKQSVK